MYNCSPSALTLRLGDRLGVGPGRDDLDPAVATLDRAADLVDAIHALAEWPPEDHGMSGVLAEELHRTLLRAADETDDDAFAEHLRLRADALKTNDFDTAIRFGAVSPMSIEFLFGAKSELYLARTRSGLVGVPRGGR